MLTVNNQAETAASFSRFIGLANVKVVAVNPGKDEIKRLFGRDLEKEPDYWDAASQQRKVTFYFTGEELAKKPDGSTAQMQINGTHTVFLKNEVETTKNDPTKMVHIDKFGKSLYMTQQTAKNLPENYRMDQGSVRPAYKGEADLIDFLKALAAPGQQDPFFIPNINEIIANGNVSIIRNLIASCNSNGNTIRVLLGIRTAQDGKKYQTIYKKQIERGTNTSLSYFWKSLVDNKDYTKDYFGNFDYSREHPDPMDFVLREYYDGMEMASSASAAAPAPVASFQNQFAAAAQPQTPSAMQSPQPAQPQGQNFQAASQAFNNNLMPDASDDLPF